VSAGTVAEVRYIAKPTIAGALLSYRRAAWLAGKHPYGLPEAAVCSNPWLGADPGLATTDTDTGCVVAI
jgi:hypothetical protein